MKTLVAVVFATLAAAASASAAAPVDYATQWTVQPSHPGAGAYAITLTPDVYRAVQRADLHDLDVLDARGHAVPADVVAPSVSSPATEKRSPPWYSMPSPGTTASDDWRVIAELDADGRLRGLRSDRATMPPRITSLVLDTGVRGNDRPDVVAIELGWRDGAAFEQAYRVEGSDDFDAWRALGRGRLVDLQQDARRLRLGRIVLDGPSPLPRYVRLVPETFDAALPAIDRVMLEVRRDVAVAPQWQVLAPRQDGRAFEFELPGRFPVRWLDLDVAGNDARSWRLQSRDGDGHWVDRLSGWTVYRVGARRSPPQLFDRPIRDRHWRLVASADGATPRLRVGYAPEQVVFVAAGDAPYTLVAGSATAGRASRPVQAALDARERPAAATLGPTRSRAGAAALRRPQDWKTWSLWAVLALGVLIVGGFAARLLREPSPAVD